MARKTSIEQSKKTFNIMFGCSTSREKLNLLTQKQTPTVGGNEYQQIILTGGQFDGKRAKSTLRIGRGNTNKWHQGNAGINMDRLLSK